MSTKTFPINFSRIFLLLLFAEILNFASFSNPGDTTWVTVWNNRKLTQYGNYDTSATYPSNKRYRKIRMHYILGRYSCPGSPQYCGSWDYTTQIYSRPIGKDSVEIARVITPYASDWLSQGRKHDYVVEVTDYASVLEGATAMRFNYSGYSWGFTITLKLEFIEGIPPMDAQSVTNIYDGYFTYGNPTLSIENNLVPKTFSYSTTTNKVFVKNSVSGHGSDVNGCGEFCDKFYQLSVNNNLVAMKQLWRKDCGLNDVYPQTGTWVYDRANWCPGAVVWPIYHDISTLTNANTNFTVNVDMETYTVSSASGGFNWVSQLLKYSAPNHSLDISIEDIKSPTKDPNYFRENPACMSPIVKIKNVGTNTITNVVFNYGLKGLTPLTYTWTGNLAFLAETEVVFPNSSALLSGSVAAVFQVSVVSVNGNSGDQNLFNNIYTSTTTPVDEFPSDFVVKLLTNKSTDPTTQKNEITWKLFDENGNTLVSRSGLSNNTNYYDTLKRLPIGCYKFVINDSGCDGLGWWANPNAGNGLMRLDYPGGGNNVFYYFPVDFGCNYTKYFVVKSQSDLVGIADSKNQSAFYLYPTPTDKFVTINKRHVIEKVMSYQFINTIGQVVLENISSEKNEDLIDVSALVNGVYSVKLRLENGTYLSQKLLIQH
jgi:hypothetical protein